MKLVGCAARTSCMKKRIQALAWQVVCKRRLGNELQQLRHESAWEKGGLGLGHAKRIENGLMLGEATVGPGFVAAGPQEWVPK